MNNPGFYKWILAGLVLTGCSREDSFESDLTPVKIALTHQAGGKPLGLDRAGINLHGEPFTITNFAYYLSHFSLLTEDNRLITLSPQYFLVNEKDPGSKQISFSAPEGAYKALQLLIGVDSARNVSGIQSGALDPANGMFWTWNTGYIFAKMEGKSPLSTAPLQNVTYHIGGFTKKDGALQTVTLNFPETLRVKKGGKAAINIAAETNAWFSGKHIISIANEPFCMDPGELARKISENYAGMFTVTSVTY